MARKKSRKPSKTEIAKLRKALNAASKEFFDEFGNDFDFLMVGPPGPRPPPKLEISILNLSSY